jgi:Uma2 family endonuclease
MSTTIPRATESAVVYPESDGQPMAENTLQFRWIVTIKENLETLFQDQPDIFVAGDLFWYPIEGHPEIRRAPDVLVVVGRPKGDRGSYRQWEEEQIAPQVVFEILSPGNTLQEMHAKHAFYSRYGVAEYYIYDPDTNDLAGMERQEEHLVPIAEMHDRVSPRLGIRFDLSGPELQIFRPDGERFLSHQELHQQRQQAEQQRQQAEQQRQQAEQQRQQAEQQRQQAEQRAAQLAARLRELGGDPDAPA